MLQRLRVKALLEYGRRPPPRSAYRNITAAAALDLVTVAFNRPDLVVEQHARLTQYLLDDFTWTVADNSLDDEASRSIAAFCNANRVAYIRLRRSYYTPRDPSRSHGEAINTVWKHYLRARQSQAIGLLDHDVLPIRPFGILGRLAPTGVFGRQIESPDGWMLWPGYAFYDTSTLRRCDPDWLPTPRSDTGGAMIHRLYKSIDRKRVQSCSSRDVDLGNREAYELVDSSLHVRNASKWREDRIAGKSELVAEALNRLSEPGDSAPFDLSKATER